MSWLTVTRILPAAALVAAGLALAALPALAADPPADQTESLSHDQAFKKLGENLAESVKRTQSDPAIPDILAELDRNIVATRRIGELLASDAEITDAHVAEIAKEIGRVAKSFRSISEMAPDVFQRRLNEIRDIEKIGARADFRIADAKARQKQLEKDNVAISKMLRNEALPASELEKLRLTRQANEAEAHSLEAAVAAWSFFSERHDRIVERIDDQSEDLDVFFHALRENARVYEAAASTLNLANSIREALADLDSLKNLDALRSELVKSWDDLMKIVDEVNDGLLLQPAM
jgi:hypothetical protein